MNYTFRDALPLLERTPVVLRALLSGLPAAWLEATEGAGTWSPRDVIAHLADLEASDWLPRVRIVLEQGEAQSFAPVDRMAFRQRLAGQSMDDLLDLFQQRRGQSLEQLRALDLTEADLARTGRHPAFGAVTLKQLLASWVVHDLTHSAQIVRVMALCYGPEVGPWREYLSVLRGGRLDAPAAGA